MEDYSLLGQDPRPRTLEFYPALLRHSEIRGAF